MAGDLGFLTGLNMGRRETSEVAAEWKQYAQGLNNQITALRQQLLDERVSRTANRADIAGIMSSISTLPADVQAQVKQALERHYAPAFVHRAMELGLPQDYASESARIHLGLNLKWSWPHT